MRFTGPALLPFCPARYLALGDIKVRPNSLAIDAGSAVDAPPRDINGQLRPYGQGYDIGAYEWPYFRWDIPFLKARF